MEIIFLATLLREDRKMEELMTGTTEMDASNNPKVIQGSHKVNIR